MPVVRNVWLPILVLMPRPQLSRLHVLPGQHWCPGKRALTGST